MIIDFGSNAEVYRCHSIDYDNMQNMFTLSINGYIIGYTRGKKKLRAIYEDILYAYAAKKGFYRINCDDENCIDIKYTEIMNRNKFFAKKIYNTVKEKYEDKNTESVD